MLGMTAQELREYVQVGLRNEAFRLQMGNGLVVQCRSNRLGAFHEVAIEASRPHADGTPELFRLTLMYGDDELNTFFATMGGIVHVLEILE